jgi:hypothetical protein
MTGLKKYRTVFKNIRYSGPWYQSDFRLICQNCGLRLGKHEEEYCPKNN